MANQVYTKTHHGLTSMVSARAATSALEHALRGKGATPDTVDVALMRKLLLGPILQEFKGILPPTGLRRNLKALADSLAEGEVPAPAAPKSAAPRPSRSAERANETASAPEKQDRLVPAPQDPPVEVAVAAAPQAARAAGSRLASALAQNPARAQTPSARQADARQKEPVALTPKQLEHMVLSFAQLEQVNLVAALDARGEVITVRGSGIDMKALSRLGLTGLRLLKRSGQLRSYYLAHPRGQLFLFPIAQATLVVVGSAELNVGAVFNTIATLKEDL